MEIGDGEAHVLEIAYLLHLFTSILLTANFMTTNAHDGFERKIRVYIM